MRYLLSPLALVASLLAAFPLTAVAQDASAGPQPVQQIQPVTPSNGTGAAAQKSIPYFVDPSRFYYNRPLKGMGDAGRYSQPTYYHGRRPTYGYGHYGCYRPLYGYGYGYYGGGPVYPHPYIRGATVQVGPFIPY